MRGYRMEERFKKRLQDDISKHFSRQSLIRLPAKLKS